MPNEHDHQLQNSNLKILITNFCWDICVINCNLQLVGFIMIVTESTQVSYICLCVKRGEIRHCGVAFICCCHRCMLPDVTWGFGVGELTKRVLE